MAWQIMKQIYFAESVTHSLVPLSLIRPSGDETDDEDAVSELD